MKLKPYNVGHIYAFRQCMKNEIEQAVTFVSTEHTRSRNMEATFRGNHEIIVYPRCNGPFWLLGSWCTEHINSEKIGMLGHS